MKSKRLLTLATLAGTIGITSYGVYQASQIESIGGLMLAGGLLAAGSMVAAAIIKSAE